MYTNEYASRGFPLRNFLLKSILVAMFAFMLVWLLPKFISPTTVVNKKTTCAGNDGEVCDMSGLDALTSQIFADNLDKMKDAAISYYTDERLPKSVGDKDKMTLSDMISKHLIIALIDKNNKAVDVDASYVEITKLDDEYVLKVNIKDSEKEDYILVHLGCYTYCNKVGVCEKQTTSSSISVKGSKVTSIIPINGTNGYYPSSTSTKNYIPNKEIVIPGGAKVTPTKTIIVHTTTPVCKYDSKADKYYGKGGNVVSKETYTKQCVSQTVEEKHYCVIYNNEYYGKYGKIVSSSKYDEECGMPKPVEKHYCVIYNSKYYGKNGNVVTKAEYTKECTTPVVKKYYCEIVNNKYYGKTGSVVSKETYNKECVKPSKKYIYEYKKTTSDKLSNWSNWSSWAKTDCNTQELNCSDNDSACLKKVQLYRRQEQIGTYKKSYVKYRNVVKQTGSYTQKSCGNYNYVIINNKTYITTKTTNYALINTITKTTRTTVGNWKYVSRKLYATAPISTATTMYIYVGDNFSSCTKTCSTTPSGYYDEYVFTGSLYAVSSTTDVASALLTSTSTSTQTNSNTSVSASCGSVVEKQIPIYSTIRVSDISKRDEPLYGTVCYSSTKSRSLIAKGSTVTKWSTYNDKTLLNSGYSYTGNKKVK